MTLVDRLRRALDAEMHPDVSLLGGDHIDLTRVDGDTLLAAAVLVPITDRAEPGVILTQRTHTMRRHAGQVAFPGGRIDPEDDGPVDAALREAEEEIALPRHHVTVIGAADRYRTGTGYDITPVLAVVPPDLVLVPSEAEVAHVFEVPLAFILNPANQLLKSAEWQGRQREYFEINWEDNRIWGATAAMIVNLSRRLQWPL
ncbi:MULTISPECIES: CoA pyrophosphatase [unclassified Sphingomonas]|uniref:CoA pyrophosphatase n=1 Tax=unclassified Sphingomonas TaxID=196159 RepID=UPI000BD38121|nr:MAG: CoA pyrophosphatase [Sphingomonas sp. 32-62-10]OYY64393.1 MAG: CoA pyrophosphatase [Sphingomonas sp. 28-62-11]